MILYLIKSTAALAIVIGIYKLLLIKTKLFQFNRFYLLASLLLALIVPSLQMEISTSHAVVAETFKQVDKIDQVFLLEKGEEIQIANEKPTTFSWYYLLFGLYTIISISLFIRFALHLLHLLRLTKQKGPKVNGMQTVLLPYKSNPFSFFGYLFISEKLVEEVSKNSALLHHEKTHFEQLHSIDILMVESLQCLLWFQPLLQLFKKEIKSNHEFLADEAASAKESNESSYLNSLLQFMERGSSNLLTSEFGYLSIKNRIKMIYQTKPKAMKRIFSLLIAVLITTTVIISSAFKPAPMNKVLYLPIFAIEKEKTDIPSILPIKKENLEKIASPYGMRINPINKEQKMHTGIDFTAAKGTPILATADGTIELAEFSKGYGNHIKIKHNNTYQSMYAHLSKLEVKAGDQVKQGDIIGIIGSTGKSLSIHLHYEVIKENENVNPADYLPYEISSEVEEE